MASTLVLWQRSGLRWLVYHAKLNDAPVLQKLFVSRSAGVLLSGRYRNRNTNAGFRQSAYQLVKRAAGTCPSRKHTNPCFVAGADVKTVISAT